jgi:hypothetical protein
MENTTSYIGGLCVSKLYPLLKLDFWTLSIVPDCLNDKIVILLTDTIVGTRAPCRSMGNNLSYCCPITELITMETCVPWGGGGFVDDLLLATSACNNIKMDVREISMG